MFEFFSFDFFHGIFMGSSPRTLEPSGIIPTQLEMTHLFYLNK